MVYRLIPDSDPRLHRPVEKFSFDNPPCDPRTLATELTETMILFGGFGLAANQCGLPYRVFVLYDQDQIPFGAFNPEIIATTGSEVGNEGCLSFPNLILPVKRSQMVTLRAQDVHGTEFEKVLVGTHARGAEHELDHLNGVTFTERVSRLRLDMARKASKKRAG